MGSKKNAIWRVVVADRRSPRDGRFIEMIGHYNPQTEPSQIVIDKERLQHWLDRGAQPSNTVRKLMRAEPSAPAAGAAVAEEPAAEDATSEGATAEDATEAAGAEAGPAEEQPAEDAEGATADDPAPEAEGDAGSG